MQKYDLHVHSNYSDGHDSIEAIIQAAIEQNRTKLAITDHMTMFGQFLYPRYQPTKSIEQYLTEITHLRKKYKNRIDLYVGAEITADFLSISHSDANNDELQGNLGFFSLFLIESILIREPILTALNVRNHLSSQGYENIPVIFAHPRYSGMNLSTFQRLLNNNIGFELNENKLTEREAAYFLDLVSSLSSQEKQKMMISFGSDSHNLETVGHIDFISRIIEENSLWKYVISPPTVQDYLVI